MAIETWIDEIAKIAGTVKAAQNGQVKSYWAFDKSEFPEKISIFPAAITYVTGVRLQGGSESSPTVCLWRGVTEFHIFESVAKQNYPRLLPFYDRIIRAFYTARTLGGKVISFGLIKEADGEGVVAANLDYGTGESGQKHLGLVAYWQVKEKLTGVVLGN